MKKIKLLDTFNMHERILKLFIVMVMQKSSVIIRPQESLNNLIKTFSRAERTIEFKIQINFKSVHTINFPQHKTRKFNDVN